MGKRARARNHTREPRGEGEVGPRQPCPCGSGRRYRNCHGGTDGAPPAFAARPFEGLASECDLVALRELVPSATAPLPLKPGVADGRSVTLCTLLPMVTPALVRQDGEIMLALQVRHSYGDPSRDLAAVLVKALDAEPGDVVGLTEPPGEGPRLQDLVADEPLRITVHDGFDFWLDGAADGEGADAPGAAAALEQANAAISPSVRLDGHEGAYWTDVGTKEHLRWVLPHPEDTLLDALARLHARGDDVLVEGSRLVGAFRAHGLLAPVWDLPVGTGAAALAEPVTRLESALTQVLAELDSGAAPLTSLERSARAGLAHRQLTIR